MIPVEKQLQLFLWFASSRENYIRIADRFGMHPTTGMKCVDRVVKAVIENLLPKVLRWPSVEEQTEIKRGFSEKGLENIIGAIDGTHIRIKGP